MHVLPAYSFAGIAFDLIYQRAGVTTIFIKKYDTDKMMELIEKYRVTDIHLVPVIINFMMNSPNFGKYDLSSLTNITYGGSPMPPELLRLAISKLGLIFMQDYGASEAGGLTLLHKEDHIIDGPPEKLRRLASCGRPTQGVDTKVLNEKEVEVKAGEIGELTVKSPAVMKGYWKSPELTKEALRDGRFYTGDLCTVDEEGFIYIKDRVKDLIISGGMNIYPFEVESALMEHPAIMDAGVIGIPDDTWGESVCAYIVFRPGRTATKAEIEEYMKNKLASFKKPKVIEVVTEIPRTLSGKILKKDLRNKYWEGRDRKV
jgi:acyl-CoA synthetase (AMP-forming)/AMP-acid ligase II